MRRRQDMGDRRAGSHVLPVQGARAGMLETLRHGIDIGLSDSPQKRPDDRVRICLIRVVDVAQQQIFRVALPQRLVADPVIADRRRRGPPVPFVFQRRRVRHFPCMNHLPKPGTHPRCFTQCRTVRYGICRHCRLGHLHQALQRDDYFRCRAVIAHGYPRGLVIQLTQFPQEPQAPQAPCRSPEIPHAFTAPTCWELAADVRLHQGVSEAGRALFGISLSSIDSKAVMQIFRFFYPRALKAGWRDIYLGSPIPGFLKARARNPELPVWQYVHARRRFHAGEPLDPQLRYYFRKGFKDVVSIQENYFPHAESLNYGVIVRGSIPLAAQRLWRHAPLCILETFSSVAVR